MVKISHNIKERRNILLEEVPPSTKERGSRSEYARAQCLVQRPSLGGVAPKSCETTWRKAYPSAQVGTLSDGRQPRWRAAQRLGIAKVRRRRGRTVRDRFSACRLGGLGSDGAPGKMRMRQPWR